MNNSPRDRLTAISGVTAVDVAGRDDVIEDLYVSFGDPELDAIVWRNKNVGFSLVLFLSARIEGISDEWLVELMQRVAGREFSAVKDSIVVELRGKERRLG